MTVSLCMIVRNEEQLLARAVASARGLADQVVIVDTGSEDGTVALAQSLGAHVITGADRMHKAQARNLALDAATGDWCVILDADETIADPVGLRAYLETTDAQAVYIRLAYVDGKDRHTLSYQQMRVWRRGTFRYQYRAHEVPVPVNGWGKLVHTEFVWQHRPPPGRTWKGDYTLNRLLLDVAENPGDARPLYYLGREYMYRGAWQDGIDTLTQYLQHPGIDKADAWGCLARCYGGLKQTAQQIEALHRACAASPLRREWWCELASIYHGQGKHNIATGLLYCALEIPAPVTDYYNAYWYGAAIYDLLARCLYRQGRYAEGITYARQAVTLDPGNERLRLNLLWFEAALGDMDAFYTVHGADAHSGDARHAALAARVNGPRVLDFGCGTGDLLLLLQAQHPDWQLTGIDKSAVALRMARERGVTGELLQRAIPLTGQTYDTICVSQVLEHVDDDALLMELLARTLAPGGRLFVTVPRDGAIPALDHRREYSAQTLTALLRTVGTVRIDDAWPGAQHRILAVVEKANDG